MSKVKGLNAECWSDPEVNYMQQAVDSDLGSTVLNELTGKRRQYDREVGVKHIRRDCLKVPIKFNSRNFMLLLDSSAELNTIRRKTAKKAMLPITSLPKAIKTAQIVTANSAAKSFAGII